MLAPRAGFDKLSPSGKGLLVEHDHAAGAVGLLHLLEALVDCGQRNALGDDGVEVDHGIAMHDKKTVYCVGEIVKPDSYNDDIREECTNGLHFFITKREAEDY